jgi:hypothetical protein
VTKTYRQTVTCLIEALANGDRPGVEVIGSAEVTGEMLGWFRPATVADPEAARSLDALGEGCDMVALRTLSF